MLFPTVEFAIYFPVVLAISWALMPHLQWWKIFIVGASYLFYGTANWKFCFLLGGVTLGNHLFARADRAHRPTRGARSSSSRAAWALDLAVLGVFKYYAFFVEDVDRVLDSIGARAARCRCSRSRCRSGISFFTFQAITYVVDTYRGHVDPRAAARRRGVPELLLAPRRRADRARVGVPAADPEAARPGERGRRRRASS